MSQPHTRLILLTLLALLALSSSASAQDAWQARHHDYARTGRAAGQGNITMPAVDWQQSIGDSVAGASVLITDINNDDALEYVSLFNGAMVARDFTDAVLWDSPPLGVNRFEAVGDFNGDGFDELLLLGQLGALVDGATGQILWRLTPDSPTVLTFTSGFGIVANLDDDPALELIFASAGNATSKFVRRYDFSAGFNAVQTVWSNTDANLPPNVMRVVLGDFDGDGLDRELALVNQTFCRAVFIDAVTGATLRTTGNLTAGRYCYGLTQAANVDADPQDELIFTGSIGTSNGSVSLTVYDYVNNANQWQHEYGVNVTPRVSLAPAGAVADLDGDGLAEVVLSVFDNQAEVSSDDGINRANQWSVGVYDGATGALVADLANRQAVGFFDIDRDGRDELMTRTGRAGFFPIPATGTLEFWTLDQNRAITRVAQIQDASPITAQAPRSPDITSRDYDRVPAAFEVVEGQPKSLLVGRGVEEDEVVTVQIVTVVNGQVVTSATQDLDGGNDVQLTATCQGLLETPHVILRNTLGQFSLYDTALAERQRLRLAGHFSEVLLAPLAPGDAHDLLYRDATNQIVALDGANASRLTAPTTRWTRMARVAADFIAVDADKDGDYEVAIGGRLSDDTPFLELVDGDGQPLWQVTLPGADIPLFALVAGDFGGDATTDLAGLVFVGGAPQVWSLDGATGARLSTYVVNTVEANQFPNRDLFVREDQNGDGFHELLLLHYTTFERLNGADLTRQGAIATFPNGNSRAASSSLIPGPTGDALFLKTFLNNNIVMDADSGAATWQSPLPLSLQRVDGVYAGFADANGDDLWDIAIPGSLGDLTVVNGLDGALLYRLCLQDGAATPLPADATPQSCVPTSPLSTVAVADIDGDDAQEFIVGDAAGWLYALAVEDGAVDWSIEVQSRIYFPAVADIDGDGALEIAVTTGRSQLSVIDNASLNPTAQVREVALDMDDQIVEVSVDIDESDRSDALAISWEAVPDADSYLVQVVTSNNTEIIPVTDVGAVTEVVFTGLALIPGTTYRANVVAASQTLGASPVVSSDGVLILGAPPTITGLRAAPMTFSPEALEATLLTAQIEGSGVILLDEVTLTLRDGDGAVVLARAFTPALTNFQLSFMWDGLDGDGALVAPGAYTATVDASDANGAMSSAQITVQVVPADLPSVDDLVATPDSFVPALGQTTQITALLGAAGNLDLTSVTTQITDADGALAFEQADAPDANTFALDLTWDGLVDGAPVAAGAYTITVTAADELGQLFMATATVTVAAPAPPVITDFVANPDAFSPANGESSLISATVTAFEGVNLTDVTLTILNEQGEPILATSDLAPANRVEVNLTWDGLIDGEPAAPGLYTAALSATDSLGAVTQATITVTVVLPGPPVISDLDASPSPFSPSNGESTVITADVAAFEGVNLAEVNVTVTDMTNAVVFSATQAPGANSLALSVTWDGLVDGAPVAPGLYTITVDATDALDQTTSAQAAVEVRMPMPPTLTDLLINPAIFSPDDGQSTTITALLTAFGGLTLDEVTITISSQGDVVWFSQTLNPGTPTLNLSATWNGRNQNGELALAGDYNVVVAAVDSLGQSVSMIGTVTVITPGPPLVEELMAAPPVINVSQGEVTQVTAMARTQSSTPLTRVRFRVRNAATFAVIIDRSFNVNGDTYALATSWDGRFGNGNPVADGDYELNVEATDGGNRRGAASTTVTVTSDMMEEEPDMGDDMADMIEDVTPDMDDMDVIEDVTPDMIEPDAEPDVVEDVTPDAEPDMIEDVTPDMVEPDMVEDVTPDVVEPDAEPDMVEPDATPDAEPDMATPDMGGPDVQGGGGVDDCDCSTPAAPTRAPSALWLLGAVGAVFALRRRR